MKKIVIYDNEIEKADIMFLEERYEINDNIGLGGLLEKFYDINPDVIVVDVDVFETEKLVSLSKVCSVIALSKFTDLCKSPINKYLNVNWFIKKPYKIEELMTALNYVTDFDGLNTYKNILLDEERKLIKILIDLGLSPNVSGYKFLKEATMISVNTQRYLCLKLKQIYKRVSANFNTTSKIVERNIRTAIKRIGDIGKFDYMNKLFHTEKFNKYVLPSNAEFISYMAESVHYDSL